MAEEEKLDDAALADLDAGGKDSGSNSSLVPMIVLIVNLLAGAGVLGMGYYTLVLFERKPITETNERVRLSELAEVTKKSGIELVFVKFEEISANLRPDPTEPRGADLPDQQILGTPHRAKISFSIQLYSADKKDKAEGLRTKFLDRFLAVIGNKPKDEILTLQGRFNLRAQIVALMNDLAGERVATDAFITEFIVQ